MEYCKINTLFKRDVYNIIIPSEYTMDEFYYLQDNLWECSEKLDGTNIRIEIKGKEIEFKGRTDKANIPSHLLDYLQNKFTPEIVFNALGVSPEIGINENSTCTIYGEGIGMKIQAVGGNYHPKSVEFVLFDIRIDNWWLQRTDCEKIAEKLNCRIVPLVGYMSIPKAIEYVKQGFKSTIAEDKNLTAEGLVLKPCWGLKLRSGERIITKIKYCDFIKFNLKYGEGYTGEQKKNLNYE